MAANPIDRLIDEANARLKKGRVGVVLEARGQGLWLYLRGTFPPPPGSIRKESYQQRVALKRRAEPKTIRDAEAIAKVVGGELNLGTFSWAKWSDAEDPSNATKVRDILPRLEDAYWATRERNTATENTWRQAYASTLKLLPPDEPLTEELLIDWIINNSEPGSRRREHYTICARFICKVAKIKADFSEFAKSKGAQLSVDPRTLPSDEEIVAKRNQIEDEGFRYIYSLIATYGLRPHEVWFIDFSEFPTIRVRHETKTGTRPVEPLYPEWADEWNLGTPCYPQQIKVYPDRGNEWLGQRVTPWFKRIVGFKPYDLRHCYARRCVAFGIQVYEASRLMGHTTTVHEKTYRAWIGEKVVMDKVRQIVNRSDRPLPPGT